MKPAEALAKRIIEGVEVGGRMIYREDQSVRTHDFDLRRIASTVAAVEVTSITDGTVRATFAAIDRYRRIARVPLGVARCMPGDDLGEICGIRAAIRWHVALPAWPTERVDCEISDRARTCRSRLSTLSTHVEAVSASALVKTLRPLR